MLRLARMAGNYLNGYGSVTWRPGGETSQVVAPTFRQIRLAGNRCHVRYTDPRIAADWIEKYLSYAQVGDEPARFTATLFSDHCRVPQGRPRRNCETAETRSSAADRAASRTGRSARSVRKPWKARLARRNRRSG